MKKKGRLLSFWRLRHLRSGGACFKTIDGCFFCSGCKYYSYTRIKSFPAFFL
jgi:hypothetical protein